MIRSASTHRIPCREGLSHASGYGVSSTESRWGCFPGATRVKNAVKSSPKSLPSKGPRNRPWIRGGPCSVTAIKTGPLRRTRFGCGLWTPRRSSLQECVFESRNRTWICGGPCSVTATEIDPLRAPHSHQRRLTGQVPGGAEAGRSGVFSRHSCRGCSSAPGEVGQDLRSDRVECANRARPRCACAPCRRTAVHIERNLPCVPSCNMSVAGPSGSSSP